MLRSVLSTIAVISADAGAVRTAGTAGPDSTAEPDLRRPVGLSASLPVALTLRGFPSWALSDIVDPPVLGNVTGWSPSHCGCGSHLGRRGSRRIGGSDRAWHGSAAGAPMHRRSEFSPRAGSGRNRP